MNVEIEFLDLRTDRTRTVGPFPFVQITYTDVRVGTEGETTIAVHDKGEWLTQDGQRWSDVIVRTVDPQAAVARLKDLAAGPIDSHLAELLREIAATLES